jgi:hypothetical protein
LKLVADVTKFFFCLVGWNNNPTAEQFRSIFRRLLQHTRPLSSNFGNCHPFTEIESNEVSSETTTPISSSLPSLTLFSENVVTYIAGYVSRRLLTMTSCFKCRSLLSTPTDINASTCKLISWRQNGGLCYPSSDMIKLCTVAEKVWRSNNSFTLKRNDFQARVVLQMGNEIKKIWLCHQSEHHSLRLIQTSLIIFFNTRRFYDVKNFNSKKFSLVKRYKLNKEIHFRSQ